MNKPPYRVPSMQEIEAIEPNGYKVVSTFSGGGGTSTGARLAGFKVVYANEFVPAASATYRANHPHTHLDGRDIRLVTAQDIFERTGLVRGELDVFEGSPPCASFSLAGKRQAGWGKVKAYSDTRQRVDDLFFEYARLLKDLQPKVFVAENVAGLVRGAAKGYFLEILAALKACGYTVASRKLDAQWLGVPQTRERIIFVGVRNDLVAQYGVVPAFPKPLPYRYTVREALPHIVKQGDNGPFGKGGMQDAALEPSGTIGATPKTGNGVYPPSLVEAVVALEGANGYNGHAYHGVDAPAATIQASRPLWCEVEHVEDESSMQGYAVGEEWERLKQGESSNKYFQLVRPSLNAPSPTITQRGGDRTAASVTHPTEKRKFSIAELKRICSFPSDYVLTGSYPQQWERCGRAVPPLMAMHIFESIKVDILERCKKQSGVTATQKAS